MAAPIMKGQDVDNGLIPVRLGKFYKCHNPGETAGFERKEVDHILKHDENAEELVKMQCVKDGKDKDGNDRIIGRFKAVSKDDVKKYLKDGYKVSGQAEEKDNKKPSKPE